MPAAENMALDEAIFERVASGQAPATLRIYGWEPPGVSLGYFQSLEDQVNLAAVERYGYGLVRRPTGGRAIIHHHEVTYSVCIRQDQLANGKSVLQSYRQISAGVELGLALLGIPACIPAKPPSNREKGNTLPAVCFARVGGGDMVVGGRKIVGSAQMRREGAILQHGSVPIRIDEREHVDILGTPSGPTPADGQALHRAAVGVAEVLGREVSFEELGRAIVAGFERAFGCELRPQAPHPEEEARKAELVITRYASEAWTRVPGRRHGQPMG